MIDDAEQRLRSGGRRIGHARRRVLERLEDQTEPVTAEVLAGELDGVHVSSVYRALAVLEEIGLVRHVHLAHGPALYELADRGSQVRHLVCDGCGRDVAVPAALFAPLQRRLSADYGFVLDREHFALTGRCLDCAGAALESEP